MSIFKQKAAANNFTENEVAPAGSHAAVLVAIIDLGTHTERGFQGKPDRTIHKVFLAWELTAEKKSASTMNHVVGMDFNASFNEKAKLRGWIEKWRGKAFAEDEEFDISVLLGKKCLLTVTHGESQKGRTFAKVDGIAPVPKGFAVPAPQTKPLQWEFGSKEPIPTHDWLPFLFGESLESVIKKSEEWLDAQAEEWLDAQERAAPGMPAGVAAGGPAQDEDEVGNDNDIPF